MVFAKNGVRKGNKYKGSENDQVWKIRQLFSGMEGELGQILLTGLWQPSVHSDVAF